MELLLAKQVSEMTGVPVGTLRYWRHSDIGPASFTLGRRVVYRRDEVLRWISERENAAISLTPAPSREARHLRTPR
jgi:predicted DNA-binding transcriptional regulator AlpA